MNPGGPDDGREAGRDAGTVGPRGPRRMNQPQTSQERPEDAGGFPAAHLYPAPTDPTPDAIVIHCSDPRFQVAFEQFLAQELQLAKGEYVPIVVGGGAGVLGHPELLPKEFKFLRERLEHYRRVFPTARRIVLINHEGCRYYESLKSKTLAFLGQRLAISPEHAREDLGLVARVFRTVLGHLGYTLELYYARFADADRSQILFEKVGG